MENLTPKLNDLQLKQNIDALLKGGTDKTKIQAYVNNYQKDPSGGYVLKTNEKKLDTTPKAPIVPKQSDSIIGSEQNFGQSIADAIYASKAAKISSDALAKHSEDIQMLSDIYKRQQTAGQDTTHVGNLLRQMINESATGKVSGGDIAEITPSVNKTEEQIKGEAGGVLVDLLAASTSLSPALAGAAFGLTHALQHNEGIGGVAVNTALGALGGKIVQYGFNAAAPFVSKLIANYGVPMLEKLAQYIPEAAMSAYKELASMGTKLAEKATIGSGEGGTKILDAASKKFEAPIAKVENVFKNKANSAFENSAQKKLWSKIQPEFKTAQEAADSGRKVSEGKLKTSVLPNEQDTEKLKILESIGAKPSMNRTEIGTKAAERVNQLNTDVKAFILQNDKDVKVGDLQKELFNAMSSDQAKRAVVFGNSTELEKAYESMINGFLGMTDGDTVKLSEIFNNRQEFDKLAKKYIPNAFSAEARDTVKKVALRDIRDTANSFVVNNIEGGGAISSTLKEESLLLDTINDLGANTKIGQTEYYKKMKKVLKFGAYFVGGYEAARGVGLLP